ncbi:hypothetical protein [Flavobacterium foetidum]|uniref:hypothetical protein n=1 Tax=Flavobacterium foetidum TaxID=2026681 RepID=UPI0010755FB9|nr:hypothetical protein [Flavobacterium foetidum]KAF2515576.1 hypothetical protein E0W73_08255 [Flavobacterium foetidum]
MEKEKVLVCDNKGIFLRMFKRKFKGEFEFSEDLLFSKTNDAIRFNRYIYVIYDKFELLQFLKMEQDDKNALICLFDKQLYNSLFFLEEIKNFILLDASKTRTEIIKDLKVHFKSKSGVTSKKIKKSIANSQILQSKFNNYYRAMFFLM